MPSIVAGKIIRYIQWSLYSGKKADTQGYYRFTRKELYEGGEVSASAFDHNRDEILEYFGKWCNLFHQGKYTEYAHEMLYIDVKYEKGTLMFRRNPITLNPALQHLWAAPPLEEYFVFDCYDEKHRRRTNGVPKYDAYPWSWTEQQIQDAINAQKENPSTAIPNKCMLSDKKVKESDEDKRIKAIHRNGGRHLQNFKQENITYAMCLVAVENDGFAIHYVPEKYRTEEIYRKACQTYGGCLSRVPKEYVSEEICKYAVSSDGLMISCVPDQFRTREIYLAAAKNNPLVMQRIPNEIMTVDFCVDVAKCYGPEAISSLPKTHKTGKFYLQLVQVYPELLWHIPKAGRTATVCSAAIKSMGYATTAEAVKQQPKLFGLLPSSLYDHDSCLAFARAEFAKATDNERSSHDNRNYPWLQNRLEEECSLPHMLRWPDVCKLAVVYSPLSLRHIKTDILTYDLCLAAVSEYYRVIEDVPLEFRTEELCMIAFEQDPYSIRAFPEEFITYDVCMNAVSRSGYLLDSIPPQFITREMCLTAVKCTGSMIDHVPEELLDEEICLAAFSEEEDCYGHLRRIPLSHRTYSVCLAAAKVDHGCYNHIPNEHRSYEVCLAAAHQNCRIDPLPEEYYTEEMCLALLQTSNNSLVYIPKKCLTEKICLLAISHIGRYDKNVLSEIPAEMLTQQMCDLACRRSAWALRDVPEKFVTAEILAYVAEQAPGRLVDNFPQRLRTPEFFQQLISINPSARDYLYEILEA